MALEAASSNAHVRHMDAGLVRVIHALARCIAQASKRVHDSHNPPEERQGSCTVSAT